MKLLHVTPYYYPAVRYGGPIQSVHGLCKALADIGHEVHVYTTSINGSVDSDVPLNEPVSIDGVRVTYFSSGIFRRWFYAPLISQFIEKHIDSFDLVHLHGIYTWPVTGAAKILTKYNVPYLVTPRGMLERGLMEGKSRFVKQVWMRLFGKHLLKHAARIHVTSSREGEELEKLNLEIPSTVIISNGIDTQHVDEDRLKLHPNDCGYVLFLGRVSWEKGLDRLIQSWGHGLNVPLKIVGEDDRGYSSKLKILADQYDVSEYIEFTGPVSGTEKWDLIRRASLLVLPSYSENFGNVILEAMSVGCPVVVTKEVGLSSMVQDYEVGIVTDGEPQSIAKAIKTLLRDQSMRDAMGERGIKTVREHFTWSTVVRQMETVYEDILVDRLPTQEKK